MGFIKQGVKPTGKIEQVGSFQGGEASTEKEVIEKVAFKKPEQKDKDADQDR